MIALNEPTIGPVRHGVQKPKRYNAITQRLRDMKVGDCFDGEFTHTQSPHSFARAAGVKVSVRTLERVGRKFRMRVWKEKQT